MTGLREKSTPIDEPLTALCRDCVQPCTLSAEDALRCPSCHSPRLIRHRELLQL
ncbi:MAG: DNA polymerase IV, partial [Rhodobiaceae bacterium]